MILSKSNDPVGLVARQQVLSKSARIFLSLISIMVNQWVVHWYVLPDGGRKAFVRHEFPEKFLMFLK